MVTFTVVMSPDRRRLAAHSDEVVGFETPQACLARAVQGITGARQTPADWLRLEGKGARSRFFHCTRVSYEFPRPLSEAVAATVLDRTGAELRAQDYGVRYVEREA